MGHAPEIKLQGWGNTLEGPDVFAKRYSATAVELDRYHLMGQPFEGFSNQQFAGYSAVLADGTAVTPIFNESLSVTCGQVGGTCDGANEIYVSMASKGGPVTPSSILVAGGFDANGVALEDDIESNFSPVAVGLAGGGFAVIFARGNGERLASGKCATSADLSHFILY